MSLNQNILITGGLGRLGLFTARHLAQAGYLVTLADLPRPERARMITDVPGVRIVECDVFNTNQIMPQFEGQQAVIHFACTTFPATSQADPIRDIQENVIGSLRLFQASQSAGVRQFIFPSSGGTVYGDAVLIPTPEDAPLQPISMHGAMKAAVEQYLRAASQHGETRFTILRISNPYGMIYESGLAQGVIDTFAVKLRAGETISVWGDGEIVRDYIHVTDMARAFQAAIQADTHQHIFNIGTGIGVPVRDILAEFGRYINLDGRVSYQPGRNFDVGRNVLDISRARAELGWSPEISLQEGIRRLVQIEDKQLFSDLPPTAHRPLPDAR